MKKNFLYAFLFLFSIQAFAITAPLRLPENTKTFPTVSQFRANLRQLFSEHINYARSYIISELADLDDKETVAHRLFQNQDEIGNAFKPMYGEEAGNKLASLLRDHILLESKAVKAAKLNDKRNKAEVSRDLSVNAEDIASWFSDANPRYAKGELIVMLENHIKLLNQIVMARINKDWARELQMHDIALNHMLIFSDKIFMTTVKQFPQRFK
jgi:hypothetical protein